MRMRPLTLIVVSWGVVVGSAAGQTNEATIVFKDGFTIKGRVVQAKDVLLDQKTGATFVIPKDGSFLYVDDDVRRFTFSPHQVQDVIPSKAGETRRDLPNIRLQKPTTRTNQFLPGWTIERYSPWNEKWERVLTVNTGRGKIDVRQRIIFMSPWQTHMMLVEYNVDQQFLTKELGPAFVVDMLNKYYGWKKNLSEVDKRLAIAQFVYHAGWYGVAFEELNRLVKEYPETKERAEGLIEQLKKLRAALFVEDLERTYRLGQHTEAQGRIAAYFKQDLAKDATEKQHISVVDLKTRYETANAKLHQARHFLKTLPTLVELSKRPFWTIAAATITEELILDNLARLETFLTFAQQHEREMQSTGKPSHSAEEVLAIAVTGWLQGNSLAEPDVTMAHKLFKARMMVQEYLKTEERDARLKLAADFSREHELPIDMLARLLKHLPPVVPYDKTTDKEQHKLDITIADGVAGSYLVQLPPDYTPYRPYPVLLALHSSRDKAADMVERLRELGAHHGYVIVAPLWSPAVKGRPTTYQYSVSEHLLVLDTLRDVRRRFNVDSDRVFLFGWEDGGAMAFDIGLAHPHEFAGVMPFNASVATFPAKCWSNAQYLPFYVVDGQASPSNSKETAALMREWVRGNYPSLFVEYRGRTSEWYAWELPPMAEWMNRKKRFHPTRELGRGHTAGGPGEEFRTLRPTNNKFYWISAAGIDERHLADPADFPKHPRPATVTANIFLGNESGTKAARIWNQISIRTTGIKQLTVWLAPNMIDFTKPTVIRVNGQQYGKERVVAPHLPTMLEEFYRSGDKDRIFYAKVEIK
ncbi:MAG: hypothetical protein NZO58_03885 [Gemmataceae bacterium]|nr:hypothetical protein [Gemmataceae bacterium]